MPLPGDASLAGEDAQEGPAVEEAGHEGDPDGEQAALPEPPQEEVAKVAEDEPAGPQVDRGRAPEDPHPQARHQGHQQGHAQEVPHPAHDHQPAQDEQGDGVGDQVGRAGVEEGAGMTPTAVLRAGRIPAPSRAPRKRNRSTSSTSQIRATKPSRMRRRSQSSAPRDRVPGRPGNPWEAPLRWVMSASTCLAPPVGPVFQDTGRHRDEGDGETGRRGDGETGRAGQRRTQSQRMALTPLP